MDRRVKYTKRIIKDTFLELLQEKDITKVTVIELCNKADINRATFYRYYLDIYDLLDKLEEEFINEVKESYKDYDYTIENYPVNILYGDMSNNTTEEKTRLLDNWEYWYLLHI